MSEWCKLQNTQHLSFTKFNEVFKNKNLSLFTPKKDQCELCVRYSVGNVSTDAYYLHQERKNEARIEKIRTNWMNLLFLQLTCRQC